MLFITFKFNKWNCNFRNFAYTFQIINNQITIEKSITKEKYGNDGEFYGKNQPNEPNYRNLSE